MENEGVCEPFDDYGRYLNGGIVSHKRIRIYGKRECVNIKENRYNIKLVSNRIRIQRRVLSKCCFPKVRNSIQAFQA